MQYYMPYCRKLFAMKKLICYSVFIVLVLSSCQKDQLILPTEKAGINWVGNWNKDSVIMIEVSASDSVKTKSVNAGVYTFNSDSVSGILTQGSDQFAITWLYNKSNNSITISEPGLIKQLYTIKEVNANKMNLSGYRLERNGYKTTFMQYLSRK